MKITIEEEEMDSKDELVEYEIDYENRSVTFDVDIDKPTDTEKQIIKESIQESKEKYAYPLPMDDQQLEELAWNGKNSIIKRLKI